MSAMLSRIVDRNQAYPPEVRHSGQFTLDQSVAVEADIVLGEKWSLYCLDIPNEQAVFVELDEAVDLADSPFVYATQYERAVRAANVPFSELTALSEQVSQKAHTALLLSTGRCGSTLASRILAKVPDVWSLSEPDWYTNLAFNRYSINPALRDELIAACMRLTCKPPEGSSFETIVIKPRSEIMTQIDAYCDVLKDTSSVFLYRDCYGFTNSLYRFAQRVMGVKDPAPGSEPWQFMRFMSTIDGPAEYFEKYFRAGESVESVDLCVIGWFLRMQCYLKAQTGGMAVTPIHYSDLNADRRTQTQLLLESCKIDTGHLDLAMTAFEKDAHAGSSGENSVPAEPISAQQRERVAELVERWGISDYVTDRLEAQG